MDGRGFGGRPYAGRRFKPGAAAVTGLDRIRPVAEFLMADHETLIEFFGKRIRIEPAGEDVRTTGFSIIPSKRLKSLSL